MASLDIQEQVPLAPYTTLGVGGPARFFAHIATEEQLLEAIAFARARNLLVAVLGGGSNLLIKDSGYPGLVLQIAIAAPTIRGGNDFSVAAGTDWDSFVLKICEQGISGVECLAGIPGLVGGSPVQNIGAYGQEVAQTIHTVRAYDLNAGAFTIIPKDACGFGYRASIFNSAWRYRYIVTEVTFRFDPKATLTLTYADLQRHFAGKPPPSPLEVYHAVRAIRRTKGMLLVQGDPDSRSAGSFFKNPIVSRERFTRIAEQYQLQERDIPHWPVAGGDRVKLSAAWLLESAGFRKGLIAGPVGISSRHALALINRGGATSSDIAELRERIRHDIDTSFGIVLQQEPVDLGP